MRRSRSKISNTRQDSDAIDNFCLACFDGEYPVSVPIHLELDKLSLEPKVRVEPAGRPGA